MRPLRGRPIEAKHDACWSTRRLALFCPLSQRALPPAHKSSSARAQPPPQLAPQLAKSARSSPGGDAKVPGDTPIKTAPRQSRGPRIVVDAEGLDGWCSGSVVCLREPKRCGSSMMIRNRACLSSSLQYVLKDETLKVSLNLNAAAIVLCFPSGSRSSLQAAHAVPGADRMVYKSSVC